MKKRQLKLLEQGDMLQAWRRYFPAARSSATRDIVGGSVPGSKRGCGRQVVVLPGYGKRDYPFPSPDELVARAIAYFIELQQQYERMGSHLELGEPEVAREGDVLNHRRKSGGKLASLGIGQVGSIRTRFCICANADVVNRVRGTTRRRSPKAPDAVPAQKPAEPAKPVAGAPLPADHATDSGDKPQAPGSVMRVAVSTMAHIMQLGREEAVIARTFDPMRGRVNNALYYLPKHLHPEKYRETAESLRDQLETLIDRLRPSLPRVYQFLKAQFPRASEEELLDAAIALLVEQLRDILTVLSIWTEAFAQMIDGLYPELGYLQFLLAQSLLLFQRPGMKMQALHLDDLFMVRYSDQGPAAIPGSRGPVGAHMIMTPMYERRMTVVDGPIYGHEFFHPVFFDAQGLAEEMLDKVGKAIRDGARKYRFSSDTVMLGKQKVPTLDLTVQLFGQTLSEMAADLVGGVSLTGDAYGYSILSVFGAFNIGTSSAVLANWLLRSSSVYGVGPNGELVFEEHMPDVIRILAVALMLDRCGFRKAAREFEQLAQQAAGLPLPDHVSWSNFSPNSRFKFEITLPISDIKQVMEVVIDTILNTKLDSLNGSSMSDLVKFTAERGELINALMNNLLKGSSDIPWELGEVYAPFVAAAAIKALWALWKDGTMPPLMAIDFIERVARKMMDNVREHFEQKEAAAAAEASAGGEPQGDPAAETAATTGDGTAGAAPAASAAAPATGKAPVSKANRSTGTASTGQPDDEAPAA